MTRIAQLVLVTLFAFTCGVGTSSGPALTQETARPTTIAWAKDLPSAMAQAKTSDKVLMVCVNARKVEGRTDDEPASKGLREIVYKNPTVVAKSQELVCYLLRPKSGNANYDALRKLGIEGEFVSPSHIFINAAGDNVLLKKEYWSHGSGEGGTCAMVNLMDKALQKAVRAAKPSGPDGKPVASAGPPAGGEERAQWISERVQSIKAGSADRETVLEELMDADKDGDCVLPLVPLVVESKKDLGVLVPLIRALGRDGLPIAVRDETAQAIATQLSHKEAIVKGNAAVTLEYIGSEHKKVVAALKKFVGKEKDEGLANHGYRALGRCGTKDAKARSLLLKSASSGKSEFATYGPCIGLAYFKGDEKAMRGVEKILKTIDIPGGARGGGGNLVKRGLVSWTLASIGDIKSSYFVNDELIGGLKNVKAFWVAGLKTFWDGVARACEGDQAALGQVAAGVGGFVQFAKRGNLERYGAESRNLMDDYRNDREAAQAGKKGFKPLGDNLLNVGE